MAMTINISQVPHLAEMLEKVRDGDEVILAEGNRPVARLTGIAPEEAPPTQAKRVGNRNPGSIWTSDGFDAPLPDEFWLGES